MILFDKQNRGSLICLIMSMITELEYTKFCYQY